MWNLVIQMNGDDPTEKEVEKAEAEVQAALDDHNIDYLDLFFSEK